MSKKLSRKEFNVLSCDEWHKKYNHKQPKPYKPGRLKIITRSDREREHDILKRFWGRENE